MGGVISSNGTKHCFLIVKDSDGSVDAMLDDSPTGANIPAGYTALVLRGSVLVGGSTNFTQFIQKFSFFQLVTHVRHFNTTSPGTSRVIISPTIPTGRSLSAYVTHSQSISGSTITIVTALDQTNSVPSNALNTFSTGNSSVKASVTLRVATDTNGQYGLRTNNGSGYDFNSAYSLGWYDEEVM